MFQFVKFNKLFIIANKQEQLGNKAFSILMKKL